MRRLATMAFSLWFYALFVATSVPVISILALFVTASAPVLGRRRTMALFRQAIRWYGATICALPWPVIRIRVRDEEPSRTLGGSIVVCNHRSAADAFLISSLHGEIVQVVNLWPMRLPILGFFARHAGYLSVRAMPSEEFLERGGKLLAEGVAIAAFPEGTRSGSRAMGPFHGTLFRLALRSRAPIIPVCIAGAEQIPARGTWVLRPGVIRICKLPALLPEEYAGLDPYHLKNRVRERMAARLTEMDAAA